MADRWALLEMKKIYRPSGTGDNLILDSTCSIFRKFEIFGQVKYSTCDMNHVNGFRNNLHSRFSRGWESKWLKFSTKADIK